MVYTDLVFDLYGTLVDIHTEENDLVWEKTAIFFGFYGAHYSGPELKEGTYTLWNAPKKGQAQIQGGKLIYTSNTWLMDEDGAFVDQEYVEQLWIAVKNEAGQTALIRADITVGKLTLDHVNKFEKEIVDAGIETETVSPKLLPDYTRKV